MGYFNIDKGCTALGLQALQTFKSVYEETCYDVICSSRESQQSLWTVPTRALLSLITKV